MKRIITTLILTAIYIITLVFNGLAGPGIYPFTHGTGNVSDTFHTCITPAGFTFSIWGFIYFGLTFLVIYSISLVFRNVDGAPAPDLGGAVPLSFLGVFSLNLVVNVAWLFTWDAEQMVAACVLLLLVLGLNIVAFFLSSKSFYEASPLLLEKSRLDFWCGVLVLNFYDTYVTWTMLASIINITIVIIYTGGAYATTTCIVMLSLVPVLFVGMAVLEATVYAVMLNFSVTPYFVYLWASYGIFSAQKETDSPALYGLLCFNMAMGAVLCVARCGILAWRNHRGLYNGGRVAAMPMEKAQ